MKLAALARRFVGFRGRGWSPGVCTLPENIQLVVLVVHGLVSKLWTLLGIDYITAPTI